MKVSIWMSALALSIAVLASGCNNKTTNPPGGSGAVNIVVGANSLGANAYSPHSLVVTTGTEVTWTNNDTMTHTVTRANTGNGDFDSGSITPGGTFRRTFNTVGTFAYICTIHPTMSGVIVVQ